MSGHDEISNVDLVDKISHIMNMPGNIELVDETAIRPGYDKKYALDDSKLKSLGWKPELDFDDSLRDVVAWTLKNRAWMQ